MDVTATFPRKIAALSAHASQIQNLGELEERVRGFLTRAASLGGLPEGRMAESFQVLEIALARDQVSARIWLSIFTVLPSGSACRQSCSMTSR